MDYEKMEDKDIIMKKRLFLFLAVLFFTILFLLYLEREQIKDLTSKVFFRVANENSSLSEDSGIKITFLDIGQGDATFIEWADGTQMLVDCAIDSRILEALGRAMRHGDHVIDYLLVTHPDQDHYGGCVDVLKRFEIKNIVYTGYEKTGNSYFPIFLQAIEQEQAEFFPIQAEQIWNIGSSTLHFLYPDVPVSTHKVVKKMGKKDASNNTSIVFTLEYEGKKILFTADAEKEVEEYLIKKYGAILDIDVLKVGHHGSSGSSIDSFLSLVRPEFAMISSGKDNRYGHPAPRTLKRLERVGAEVWRTDEKGDIILHVRNNELYVETQ